MRQGETRPRLIEETAMFNATCKNHVDEPFNTDDPVLFVAHMRDDHKKRPLTRNSLAASTDRVWRTPSPKAFDPGPFDVGAWVTWEASGSLHTGQVWAIAGPRRRWVADGLAYHEVYDDQLVTARAAA